MRQLLPTNDTRTKPSPTPKDAFDDAGNLTKPKERAINKIGHYLHALSPPFARLLRPEPGSPEALADPAAVARSLGFADPRCLQSMVICKQPEIGGAVPPHQDSTFLYTEPPSAVGFWYALEDATLENGCLSFLPGSHRVSRRCSSRHSPFFPLDFMFSTVYVAHRRQQQR